MRSKSLLLTLGMLLPISFSSEAIEKSNQSQLTQPKVSLTIKPLACVVKHAGENCQMTITAHWQGNMPIDACLFQEQQNLKCWQQQQQAKASLAISIEKDMNFVLKSSQGEVLASQRIKINVSQSQQYRRRLRAQWSLF